MRAKDIMTTKVVSVHANDTVHRAVALMTDTQVASLPVLDDEDRVIGIISESDIIRDRMPTDARSHMRLVPEQQPDPRQRVRDVMSEMVECMGENADTADLAALMLDNNVRAVPIVDGARLVGIVSRRDLLRTLLRDDAAILRDVRQALDDYAGESERWPASVEDGVVTIHGRFDGDERKIVELLARSVAGVIRVHTQHH
jgi:CBS domain-containing protein